MTVSIRDSFLAGLALVGFVAALAVADEPSDTVTLSPPKDRYIYEWPRMSVEQSQAIKREMCTLPGLSSTEEDEYRRACMRIYQLDHITPLCLGGVNDRSNLQLQPWPEARQKDDDEVRLCKAVSRGEMSRKEAISELLAKWPRNNR